MRWISLKMLVNDRAKFIGLSLGIAFTAFLITFALSYFSGFMTRGFALISENPSAKIWVMDPAVESPESTINLSDSTLEKVRSVPGVRVAKPLGLAQLNARFPDGHFLEFQFIGVDNVSLTGAPQVNQMAPEVLRRANTVLVDAGGTSGKLHTPCLPQDQWPADGAHLSSPQCPLKAGDLVLINNQAIRIAGVSHTLPRFPPHPLMYGQYNLLTKLLPGEDNHHLTFILVSPMKGVSAEKLAHTIQQQTGLKALTQEAFIYSTLRWFLINSEDVGDMTAMLILAITVGFGVTGIMLSMFTLENLRYYALFKAIGASNRVLTQMMLFQTFLIALISSAIGIGFSALAGWIFYFFNIDYPFRLLWFSPLLALTGVFIIAMITTLISIRPVWKLHPAEVLSNSNN